MSEFQAFHLAGYGRLVVCEPHATDVWMWLWLEAEPAWTLVDPRGNDRTCAVCTPGARCPEGLDAALKLQGRPVERKALKRAA